MSMIPLNKETWRKIMSEKSGKKKSNEIVKYHNNLADVSFKNFKAADLDLFMSICMKCLNQGTNVVTITEREITAMAHYGKDIKRFREDFKNLKKKIKSLEIMLESGELETDISLFPTIQRNKKTGEIKIRVNEDLAYILNEFKNGKFTEFELEEFVMLRSTYSRLAYRQLKRFKDTGIWTVSIEKFRELMDVPKNYRMDNINQRVLAPIKEELTEYFEGLKVEKITETTPGKRGRPAVVGLKFTFKKTPKKELKKIQYPCPVCGGDLYEIERNDGRGIFYGHKDGKKKGAKCKKTFSTIAEIRGIEETPGREDKAKEENNREYKAISEESDRGGELTPEEHAEKIKKLKETMGVMF